MAGAIYFATQNPSGATIAAPDGTHLAMFGGTDNGLYSKNSSGTITQYLTSGTALGGVLSGTLPNPSFATIAANSLYVNNTAGVASPTVTALATLTLNQFGSPSSALSMGSQRITNLANAVAGTDVPNLTQVQSLIATGVHAYLQVQTAATTNISVSAPGATIGGYTLTANDIVILTGQTNGAENGPWTWNGAAVALTRPTEYASGSTVRAGYTVIVGDGTSAGDFVFLSTDNVTVDTTVTTWSIAPGPAGYSGTAPITVTGSTIALTTPLSASFGGTGAGTLTAHSVLLGNGTGALGFATIGTSGRVLIDQGAGVDPSFNAISGDGTLSNTGALTVTKTSGSAFGTMATQNANAVAITGGTINGATVGATTASTGAFTTLTATQATITQSGATFAINATSVGAGSTPTVNIGDTGTNGANLRLSGNGATTPSKYIRAQGGTLQFLNDGYTATLMTVADTGNTSIVGNTNAVATTAIAAISGSLRSSAWTTSGIALSVSPTNLTDNTSTGTVTEVCVSGLAAGTIIANAGATTYSYASTLRIGAAPAAGANVTISNALSLMVNGKTWHNDQVTIASTAGSAFATPLLSATSNITTGTASAISYSGNLTATGTSQSGFTYTGQIAPTGASTQTYVGMLSSPLVGNSNLSAGGSAHALRGVVTVSSSVTAQTIAAGSFQVVANATTSITTSYGLHVETPSNSGSGITTNYGLKIESQANGTITHVYGLHQSATGDLNIVAGKTSIGQTSDPTALVHLGAGTASANTSPLKFTGGTLLTTAEAGAMEYDGNFLFFSPSASDRRSVQLYGAFTTVAATSYSLLASDTVLLFNASGTTTFTGGASSSNKGRTLFLQTISAQAVNSASSNILPLGSTTAGTAILPATSGKFVIMISNGTNWQIVAGN